MLPKFKRLNLTQSFSWVKTGNKIETPSFRLLFKFGQNTQPLVGIAISAKTFKKAHDRNRAKRVSSKAIEQRYNSLPKGLNLVIMPKQESLNKELGELIQELEDAKLGN